MGLQIGRHGVGEPDDGVLGQVVEQIAAVPEGVAVGDLDNQSGVLFDHERCSVPAGDDVAVDRSLEQFEPLGAGKLPKGQSPLGECVATPDVVHQDVQSAVVRADAREKPLNLRLHGVVGADRDAAAARRGDHLRGFLDRFGPSGGGGTPAHAPARAVDGGASGPQHAGDPAAGAAGGPRDDGHLAAQRPVRHGDRSPLSRTRRSGDGRSRRVPRCSR